MAKSSLKKVQTPEDPLAMHNALMDQINQEMAELEARLQQLRDYKAKMAQSLSGVAVPGSQKGIKIAPKYRNPANPNETWAGRGMYPKWLDKALKSGKKLEDFAI